MGTAAEVRAVLVDAALSKMFCDEQESIDVFMANHKRRPVSVYIDCPDNFCTHARRQADDVIDTLTRAGFSITKDG